MSEVYEGEWHLWQSAHYSPLISTQSFTQANTVDPHSVGSLLTFVTVIGGKTYRSCQKHGSLSLHDIAFLTNTGRHFFGLSFVRSLKSNLCKSLTAENTTENYFFSSGTKNTTQLRTSAFVTVIYRLVVTSKGRLAFPRANHCQCQLQNPQSVKVFVSTWFGFILLLSLLGGFCTFIFHLLVFVFQRIYNNTFV